MHLIAIVLLAGIFSVSAFAQDSCGFLHQQTQAFSDAGQRRDGAAMAKMLDPDVIFFNETGEKATGADMAGATPPAAGASIRTITTTDWDCKVHGDVAVTSFIDVLEQGKPSELRFRSVETWRKEGAGWKMIGSETLSLQQDPDPVVLDGKALDEYAGTYEAGATPKVFQRDDNGKVTGFIYLRGKNSIVFKRVV
jgi:ketosteroid isomerase-like protein